jgi:hypothetical protein
VTYDDGGLVDINHTTVDAMARMLELTTAHAEEIARARTAINGFSELGELGAYTSLPATVVDGMSERAIFLQH